MSTDPNHSDRRPDKLTADQRVRYEELVCNVDESQNEAEFREILAHPETWVSAEEMQRRVDAILFGKNGTYP